MNSNKELLVTEWFSKAEDDEKSAAILLREDGPYHTVCFLCQQMTEKYLKAYLVAKQKSFPRIHQLVPLLDLCVKHDPSFADLKQDAASLSEYYLEMRYPADIPEYTSQEATKAFAAASRIRDFVKVRLVNH